MFLKYTKWALLWALLIFILCAIPGRDIPHISFLELLNFDKWVHAVLFFVLVILLTHGFSLQNTVLLFNAKPMICAVLLSVIYGGLLEVMQGVFFQERTAELFDFIANSFGSVMGIFFYDKIESRWQKQ